MNYVGKTRRTLKQRISEHTTQPAQPMYIHSREKGRSGFSVEVLEQVSPERDLAAAEDLWITIINPSINKQGLKPMLDQVAISNLYMFSVLKKIKE